MQKFNFSVFQNFFPDVTLNILLEEFQKGTFDQK